MRSDLVVDGQVDALPLTGTRVRGDAVTAADAIVVEHLSLLGASHVGGGPLRVDAIDVHTDWQDLTGRRLDEVTAQAALGLMAVHGRASGSPARIGVPYVSTVAGVVAAQGALAALLAGSRGQRTGSVRVSVAGAAMLTVSQYLAAGSAEDGDDTGEVSEPGVPPPFTALDGVVFEVETLDPEPWRRWWTSLGAAPGDVARGWRAFVLRYATAAAPIPPALHEITRRTPFVDLCVSAQAAGVAVQEVRGLAARRADVDAEGRFGTPWKISAGLPAADLPELPAGRLPLHGLRVVEAGRRIQGPLAGHVLRLLGAEVTRVEPAGGDPLRGMPPMVGDCSARFLALNRGKRIVEVDLRSASGRSTVRNLVDGAHVFLHNWAPGKAAEFGLDSADFTASNPGLVYAYASGWGDARGADAPPGTDFVAQAYTGLGEQLRPAGEPRAGSLMTLLDVLGGLVCAEGVLAALVARQRDRRGQRVDTSLLSAAGVLQAPLPTVQPTWTRWDMPVSVTDGHIVLAVGSDPVVAEATLGDPGTLTTDQAVSRLAAVGVSAVRVCPDPGELADDPATTGLIEIDGCAFVRPPWRFTS
ncbi:CoA transferase [Micromonospora sp. WMMD1155]|uniref:CoA transferase n=1 Tax=Micromonospora sp. WMMD1155 TaxID=3016094 RepID=UPI00249C0522|nr:CoA transferase [Micromonospora sp. WMMD1155]WFE53145.1 CoA transferase [Micromonospora sp. WMMD1155]